MARIKDEIFFEKEEGRGDTILSFEEEEDGETSLSPGGEKPTNETLFPLVLLLAVLDVIAFIAISFLALWTTDSSDRFSCEQWGSLPTPTRIIECNADNYRIKFFLKEFVVALFFFLVHVVIKDFVIPKPQSQEGEGEGKGEGQGEEEEKRREQIFKIVHYLGIMFTGIVIICFLAVLTFGSEWLGCEMTDIFRDDDDCETFWE